MNAEVIAIGTELLLGTIVNTDTAFLSRTLAELGIPCYRQVTVGDNPGRLAEAIETALGRADLVITCGGLGPTVDDVTLETIARVTGRRLRLQPEVLRKIRRRFARLNIRMPASNRRQALLPEGAAVFPNDIGTAPGFLLRMGTGLRPVPKKLVIASAGFAGAKQSRFLVALPGPPAELIPMVRRSLIPRLRRLSGGAVIQSRTLHVTGLTESEVDAKVKNLLAMGGAVTVGIYAHPGQIDLRITARAKSRAAAQRGIVAVERKIRKRLGDLIYGADEETLEGAVGRLLTKRRKTLAVAESCTGGLVQHRITEVAGSSAYFRGGVVAYANELKRNLVEVPARLLARHGAVSAQVAAAMAEGIRCRTSADLGLAITGIAGPTGGSKAKPVGLVYIALGTAAGTRTRRHLFSGPRSMIKWKASQAALDNLRLFVIARRQSRRSNLSRGRRPKQSLARPAGPWRSRLKARLPRPPSAASQ